MNLYNSTTYKDDLKQVLNQNKWINNLSGSSILITGSSGLICSGVVDLLIAANELDKADIQIYAAGRDAQKVIDRFSPYSEKEYFHCILYDANKENSFDFHVDYIIHGASKAFPKAIQAEPVETLLDNVFGLYYLLDYAKKTRVKRLLYISSSEVYGNKVTTEPFKEDEYGAVNHLLPRSSYSSGKRAAETMCISFVAEYGVDAVIVRPGHIYGPTASQTDNRVSSVFAYQVARGENLVLKSDGSQIRSYCYVLDAATSILIALLKGENSNAYNISNPNSVMSIRQMAKLYAEYGGVKLLYDLPTEAEKAAFNPMINSSLNSEKIQKLGWSGIFDGKTGIDHTVRVIREVEELSC